MATLAPSASTYRRRRRLKPWHWTMIAVVALLLVPLLWFLMAYAGLPRLWSHHEHKKMGQRDQIQTYTEQDIPGDPINLRIHGSRAAIACAFTRAGWSVADPVSVLSGLGIAASVGFGRPYPAAPVSPLYVLDRPQDFAVEKSEGKSADKRHHIRFWQIAPDDWLADATFDRGVGVSLFTLQVTHHIAPDVDGDRDAAGGVLVGGGAKMTGIEDSRIAPGVWHRNGGGDRYRTDGRIKVFTLPDGGCR